MNLEALGEGDQDASTDTVYTPPGEEHWHGGTADNMMCHFAMLEGTGSGDETTWLEPVIDEQSAAANQS